MSCVELETDSREAGSLIDRPRIVVAHPGRQHSYRLAAALEHHGMLHSYVTTVYNRRASLPMRMLFRIIRGDALVRARQRRCADIPDSKVCQLNEFLGLLLLLVQRADRTRVLEGALSRFISRSFQRRLARYIVKEDVDAVISYDTNSEILFHRLLKQAPHVIRIMDNAQAARNYLRKVYCDLDGAESEFDTTLQACRYMLDTPAADSFVEEIRLADYHIVASSFSRDSIWYNDIGDERIIFAPYGVDLEKFRPSARDYSGVLKVLFVGEVNQRKGIRQVLEAARALAGMEIEFDIVGKGRDHLSNLYTPYESYVRFWGDVTFEDVSRFYSEAHVFVFPSLGEGFGLVVLEALASGLPVIASMNCAGPDHIADGENGFLIEPGDTRTLIDRLTWFLENRDQLPLMAKRARLSVENLTWENYEMQIIAGVRHAFSSRE